MRIKIRVRGNRDLRRTGTVSKKGNVKGGSGDEKRQRQGKIVTWSA